MDVNAGVVGQLPIKVIFFKVCHSSAYFCTVNAIIASSAYKADVFVTTLKNTLKDEKKMMWHALFPPKFQGLYPPPLLSNMLGTQ